MPAPTVDADTVALYLLDQTTTTSPGNYYTAVDSAAFGGVARDLSEDSAATGGPSPNYTHIVNGPVDHVNHVGETLGRFARWFPGIDSGARLFRAGDDTIRGLFRTGTYTFEAWIYPDTVPGKIFNLMSGLTGDPSGNTPGLCLCQIGVRSDGHLYIFWERDSRGNEIIQEATSSVVATGAWSHIAITVDGSTVKFYVNGSLTDTFTGVTRANHGETADLYLSYQTNTGTPWHGALKDVRISNVARSLTDIALAADPTEYNCRTPIDANTVIMWRLDEQPDAIEETDYGYHARIVSGDFIVAAPLNDDAGHARQFDATTELDAHWGYEPFRTMLAGTEWTWDAWFTCGVNYDFSDKAFWAYGYGTSEASADNLAGVDLLSTAHGRYLRYLLEHGSGTDGGWTSFEPPLATVADGYVKHYIALTVKYDSVAAVYRTRLYLDGALIQTGSYTDQFDGGANSWLRMAAGITNLFDGVLDNMRWSKRALAADEIGTGPVVCPPAEVPIGATISTALPKKELRISVPENGLSFKLTDAGHSASTLVIPTGYYFLTSPAPSMTRGFLAELAFQLGGSYTVDIDDDVDDATGRVTISIASGVFSIQWVDTFLRDILGFAGATTSTGASATGTAQARYLWLPNVQRVPLEPDPVLGEDETGFEDGVDEFGRPEADYIVTTSPSGHTTQSVFSQRFLTEMQWANLWGQKLWRADESAPDAFPALANQSLWRFWRDCMLEGGAPWRYHNDRANDTRYWTEVFEGDVAQLKPESTVGGWVGPKSLWKLSYKVRKYIPGAYALEGV